jgi:hypothetical protein
MAEIVAVTSDIGFGNAGVSWVGQYSVRDDRVGGLVNQDLVLLLYTYYISSPQSL